MNRNIPQHEQEWIDNLYKPMREGGYPNVRVQDLPQESSPIEKPLDEHAQNDRNTIF